VKKERLSELFSPEGIVLGEAVGLGKSGTVYKITYSGCPEEKQVLKVIDVAESVREFVDAGYSEERVRSRLRNLYERELGLNERITATRSEYLVRILDLYSMEGGQIYAIRMPRYETLRSLRGVKALEENVVIRLGLHLREALRVLHHNAEGEYYRDEKDRFGVMLHMDIKPDNIFYQGDTTLPAFMLGDFGTLVDKENGVVIGGTPNYLPPEAKQGPLTEAADLYALGITLYYCLCEGEDPDGSVEAFAESRNRGEQGAKPADCSRELWTVIEKATCAAPQERYQTAQEMWDALQAVAQTQKQQLQNAVTGMKIAAAAYGAWKIVKAVQRRGTQVDRLEIDGENVYFDGALKHGKPHGKGVYAYLCGEERRTISGDFRWVEREKSGRRKERIEYTGMKSDGKYCGWGILKGDGWTYVGTLEDGEFRMGTIQWTSGEMYTGSWMVHQGKLVFHGAGTYTYADGSWYEGGFAFGLCHGFGILHDADGTVHEGRWKDGIKEEA